MPLGNRFATRLAGTVLFPRALLLVMAFVAPSFAVDGVVEINQICAVQTGCFAGDVAGYPVTIDGTAGRSYRLTSDLTVATPVTAIELTATHPIPVDGGYEYLSSDVRIDLNGFRIACAVENACDGGIDASGGGGIKIGNGSFIGMQSFGIRGAAYVSDVVVKTNNAIGISSRSIFDSKVTGGTIAFELRGGEAHRITSQGTTTGGLVGNGVVRDSSFSGTGDVGVSLGDSASLINVDVANYTLGVRMGDRALIKGSNFVFNGSGVEMKSGIISDSSISSNAGAGVTISPGPAAIVSNSILSNAGPGIVDDGQSGYGTNVLRSNNGGNESPQVSGAVEMGTNLCGGDTTCP